jgi:hypothetical protein
MAWAIEWGAALSVDDADWHTIYGIASPMLQCAMDLALRTGLGRGDLLRLDRAST